MDTNGWLVLAANAAWPLVILVIVLALMASQRGPVGRLIDRIKAGHPGGSEVELEAARVKVEELLNKVAEPPASAFLAESSKQWHRTVEDLVREACQLGWHIAAKGDMEAPDPRVDWEDDGPLLRVRR